MAISKPSSSVVTAADEAIAPLADTIAELKRQNEQLAQQVQVLTGQVARLQAVAERDTDLEPFLGKLGYTIQKQTTPQRVADAVDGAKLQLEPFPYTVIDDLLPITVYRALLRGIPPVELFLNNDAGKPHLPVPFKLAPAYSQQVWHYVAGEIVPNIIAPRLIEKFRASIDEWITRNWPDIDPRSVALQGSEGRIMFRGRGYRIRPHRDPKWAFITCILYLARPGDDEAWGTQLYYVDDDKEAKNVAPHWIDEGQCRLADDVKFIPNRLLVFLNSVGAHGASIPADAEPPDLERYIYQFRIGPTLEMMQMLKSKLPKERQPLWSGKASVDY
jgi:hypothetical protein